MNGAHIGRTGSAGGRTEDATEPAGHVGLVRKAAGVGDGGQRLVGSGDPLGSAGETPPSKIGGGGTAEVGAEGPGQMAGMDARLGGQVGELRNRLRLLVQEVANRIEPSGTGALQEAFSADTPKEELDGDLLERQPSGRAGSVANEPRTATEAGLESTLPGRFEGEVVEEAPGEEDQGAPTPSRPEPDPMLVARRRDPGVSPSQDHGLRSVGLGHETVEQDAEVDPPVSVGRDLDRSLGDEMFDSGDASR